MNTCHFSQPVQDFSVLKALGAHADRMICPCCNRYFEKLHRHMQSKHKNYVSPENRMKVFRKEQGLSQYYLERLIGLPSNYLSMYENRRKLPEYASDLINEWVEENL